MRTRVIRFWTAFLFAFALTAAAPITAYAGDDGIVRVKSDYPLGETIERLKKDIADKGIKFFDEIDQAKLDPTTFSAPQNAPLNRNQYTLGVNYYFYPSAFLKIALH